MNDWYLHILSSTDVRKLKIEREINATAYHTPRTGNTHFALAYRELTLSHGSWKVNVITSVRNSDAKIILSSF